MTNEKLVEKIKSGKTEYISDLWKQVYKFIDMQAGKVLENYPEQYRSLREDMVNESYFYFLKAINAYDSEQSSFVYYLNYYIKNAFLVVINGGRTERAAKEPLNHAISYDMPIQNAENLTIADMLIDDTAEEYHRYLEDQDFWNSVNQLLRKAICKVESKDIQNILLCMLQYNCSIRQAEQITGLSHDRYKFEKAIVKIKKYLNYSQVKRAIKEIGLDDYIYGWGYKKWKNSFCTSATEYYALQRIGQKKKDAAYRIVR